MAEQRRLDPWVSGACALAFLVFSGSCRQIVGIDGSGGSGGATAGGTSASAGTLADSSQDGSASAPPSSLCTAYCDAVMDNCDREFSAYETKQACLGVCKLLPPGGPDPDVSNSVTCRLRQAQNAAVSSNDHARACAAAGPGGNGQCGSDCAAYCMLYEAICQPELDQFPETHCPLLCPALKDQPTFDAQLAADGVGDTVECRLVHVSNATLSASNLDVGTASLECEYAAVYSPLASACINNPGQAPTCDEYCRFVAAVCDGPDYAVYENTDQCLATCAVLELGHNADLGGQNTVGCRLYEAHNAVLDPVVHCPRAGPSGDQSCGDRPLPQDTLSATADAGAVPTDNCDSYCRILHHACSTRFDTEFSGDEDACSGACGSLPGALEFPYTVSSGMTASDSVNEYACRLLNAVRALSAADYCDAAFGGSPCDGTQ